MSLIFDITASQFFERTLQIQSIVGEEIESMKEVMNNYVLVNNKHVVEFQKGEATLISFNDLPEYVKETVMKDHIEEL